MVIDEINMCEFFIFFGFFIDSSLNSVGDFLVEIPLMIYQLHFWSFCLVMYFEV